jgi:hypothetical protein
VKELVRNSFQRRDSERKQRLHELDRLEAKAYKEEAQRLRGIKKSKVINHLFCKLKRVCT